jgi:HAE1 family hydrophobic/amphiphilic exporter-1
MTPPSRLVYKRPAITEAMPLPPGMPTPPSFRRVNPGDQPIIFLFLTSPTMRLSDLDEYAETLVAQRISMVSGVAQVQVFGSAKYAVRVQADPNRLASRQIGLNEIDSALRRWNVNIPTGTLYEPHTAYNVQVNGQLMKAWQYRPMIVAYRNGAPTRSSACKPSSPISAPASPPGRRSPSRCLQARWVRFP